MSYGKFLLELTRSQQMALLDMIMEHLRCAAATGVFVNCSESPAVETTPGDLLTLVTEARYVPSAEEIASLPTGRRTV
jgi:hypothetical protein